MTVTKSEQQPLQSCNDSIGSEQDKPAESPPKLPAMRKYRSKSTLDFSKSQISPAYAQYIGYIAPGYYDQSWKRHRFHVVEPKARKGSRPKGTDSNKLWQNGSLSPAECSPRGFMISNLTSFDKGVQTSGPGPREGTLKRRSVPQPKDRMFIPTLICEDESAQRKLEAKKNRDKAVMSLYEEKLRYEVRQLEEAQEEEFRKFERSKRREEVRQWPMKL